MLIKLKWGLAAMCQRFFNSYYSYFYEFSPDHFNEQFLKLLLSVALDFRNFVVLCS
jgi:hypothetical protein